LYKTLSFVVLDRTWEVTA